MKTLVLLAAAATLTLKDLPPVVQKTVQERTKGADIKGISSETEHGKTTYEIETMVNGKHRDLDIDSKGVVTEVEDETDIASIPPAAKATIAKKATGGRIVLVETVTAGGSIVAYEAEYIDKNGRKREVRVKPDGAEVKD
ncbi:MAG: hypothetical protein WDO73_35420 [Ignavibacteriota bacterium]